MAVSIPQILVAGLGNLPMPSTRHSLGQHLIDALAQRLGIRMSSDRKGIIGQGIVTLGETPVSLILYKSKSFMNVSGPSIAEVYRNSMSHRVVPQIGHNGIKSIISALGGEQGFYRFRLGIGERGATDAASFVMGRLTPHEREYWSENGLDLVIEEIERIARKTAR
ncbi:peptidyl-tRNA hydrolase [Gymnopus androsaceus JB14]|uniref:Peptidyl-tRNA hydrolase n=1 Tax=Gymnopus androsaceus JB14 TaxID=1447944 RepID=A0A6A4HR58_9AGAR|nr:peptidyl-tRNA hydrolase [Gymnopus androsaceus JB14]